MLLLGDLGQQLDLQDMSRAVDEMRYTIRSGHGYDRRQDEQIAALQRENDELKLYVGGLVQLLKQKNVLTQQELSHLVNAVESGERGTDAETDGRG
jgi:hypothetical protein